MFLIHDSSAPVPSNLDFSSHNGSSISLGNFKRRNKVESFKEEFLTHNAHFTTTPAAEFEKGLDRTKFHKGFQRRYADNIVNPIADQHKEFSEVYYKKSRDLSHSRSKILEGLDKRTGYDLITGKVRGEGPLIKSEGLRKIQGNGLGSESIHRGKQMLRDSNTRYFSPISSGPSAEYRQSILYSEGLSHGKSSSIIQLGKKDLESFGVEDQFSKSLYMSKSESAFQGLNESRQPGKFTPRKVPQHPSGNPEIIKQWSSTVDINNKTIRNVAK